jgi:hypothetical protein
MTHNAVTYGQFEQLLAALGFQHAASEQQCRVYYHAACDTLVVLPAEKADVPARSGDVLSVRRDLVDGGHLDENSFNEFLCRGVPPVPH